MNLSRAVLAATILSACGTDYEIRCPADAPPLSCAATAVAWDAYGWPAETVPVVEWRMGAELNCGNGRAFSSPVGCVSGLFITRPIVALPAGAKYHETALAHEVFHNALGVSKHNIDPGHKDQGWLPGGPVDEANARIRALETQPCP